MNKPLFSLIRCALRGILSGIAGALVFYLLVFLISVKCFDAPSFFGWRPYFILSESMEPTIRRYQVVLAKVVNAEDVETGDIVVYVKDGSPVFGYHVIHRVEAVEEGGFVLKGDNNRKADRTVVLPEQVLYKVVWY